MTEQPITHKPDPDEIDQECLANPLRNQYTLEALGRIKTILMSMGSRTTAYRYAGIGRTTFYEWLNEIPSFEKMVIRAENAAHIYAEQKLVGLIKAGDGPSIRFYLERKMPDEYKPRSETEITGPQGGPLPPITWIVEVVPVPTRPEATAAGAAGTGQPPAAGSAPATS